jgi:hypothetical protein
MVALLPFEETSERQSLDKILIFEEPNSAPGREGMPEDYSIGIDTADGLGQDDEDRSVCSISRSMKGENCDEQVAEFTSNRINAPQMVGFAACLAAYYGQNTLTPEVASSPLNNVSVPVTTASYSSSSWGSPSTTSTPAYDGKASKREQWQQRRLVHERLVAFPC